MRPERQNYLLFTCNSPVADVPTHEAAWPLDGVDRGVRLLRRLGDILTGRGHAEHAATRAGDLAILHRGTRVKNLDAVHGVGRVEALDDLTLGVASRVALGRHDDVDGHLIAPLELPNLVELALGRLQEQVHEVAPHAGHHALALRVAEPDVVLKELDVVALDHEPGEDDAREGAPLGRHAVDGGLDDVLHHPRLERGGENGGGGVGAHAAGVEAGVALAHALVVLRADQGDRLTAADHREEGRLLAIQEILDDDFGARGAERRVDHHVVHGVQGGLYVHRDNDAFARGESIRLDDDGRTLFLYVGLGRLGVGEALVLGGGDVILSEEILEETLGALEPGGVLGGSEARDVGSDEGVGDAVDEGRLGTDHHEADVVVLAELDDSGVIGVLDVHDLNAVLDDDARVAGRAVELAAGGALLEAPAQGVLAPAAADDEDVHLVARRRDGSATTGEGVDDQHAALLVGAGLGAEGRDGTPRATDAGGRLAPDCGGCLADGGRHAVSSSYTERRWRPCSAVLERGFPRGSVYAERTCVGDSGAGVAWMTWKTPSVAFYVADIFGKVFSAQQVLRESHAERARTQTMCF